MKHAGRSNQKERDAFMDCVRYVTNHASQNPHWINSLMPAKTDDLSGSVPVKLNEYNGIVANIVSGDWKQLCHRDHPSIVKTNEGDYLLVIRASESGVLLYDKTETKTSILSKETFLRHWSGYAIIFDQERREKRLG